MQILATTHIFFIGFSNFWKPHQKEKKTKKTVLLTLCNTRNQQPVSSAEFLNSAFMK